jgi:hypothetical protein
MYALALLAIANGVQISVYTDLRTISGWRCGAVFMPMLWFLLSIVEHGWGMLAARVQLWPVRRRAVAQTKTEPANPSAPYVGVTHLVWQSQAAPQSKFKLSKTQWPHSWLRCLFASDLYTQLRKTEPTPWSECIFWAAQASALVHMIFGILVLSSLVFIRATESVQVFARFALSIFLCQIVVQSELAMMRAELAHREEESEAVSLGIPVSSIAMEDSQAGRGASREHMATPGASESIRSQRSCESSGYSVPVIGY